MKREVCDQLISEAEELCQKLGGDLYEVMKKAPLVVEKWKRHYLLAHEIWQHARSREELSAFLLSGPDPSPEELETWLIFIRAVPFVLRKGLQRVRRIFEMSADGAILAKLRSLATEEIPVRAFESVKAWKSYLKNRK